ncbi:hypothetical protein A8C32_07490 [Flavivirga aquatica]|uniref:Uncharacterized protein n=1 Tax=Flavivirga aquatica TaxID=1849968 RepID=A0A1E5SIS2_9FLAO|nr:tetratricopeptide repeat protein [Flavivirga aquatica]OEJ99013.1 hypothetical protein A8C32_07490 [Flavivirga aquatica]
MSLHGQQFKTYQKEGTILIKTSSDSVLKHLKNEYKKTLRQKDTSQIIKNLISLSAFERIHLNYSSAFNNSGKALFLAEEFNDSLLIAKAQEELGVLTYLFKQDDEAGSNFKKAHLYYKALYKNKKIQLSDLYQSHYNLVLYYQRIVDKKSLKAHIDSCYTIANKGKHKLIYQVYLNEKKSSLKEWENKPQEALKLLNDSATTLENLDNQFEVTNIHKSFLIIIYGRIGNIYMNFGRLDLAKNYFNKSINIEDINSEHTFYKSFIHARYATLLFNEGDYENAYLNQQKSNTINNTYLNLRNDKNRGFLTIKNHYKDELDKKNVLLNKQNFDLNERNQKILRFRIFFFIAFFLFIITALIVRSKIKFLKYQKKEQNSKELLDIKNSELTISTLQLIEKEEVIKSLSDHIKKYNADNGSKLLLKSIENRSVSLWDAFNNRFISQNDGFYERLKEKVPNLSSADLKICALIKLNFSGKEMAYLLGISLGSVHVARHRLRKKIGLERDINLTNYINSI